MKLALRWLIREWRAGELGILVVALAIAVAAVTTVGFFTDRVRLALGSQANQLLAADLVVIADHPLPQFLRHQAESAGLRTTETLAFPTMAVSGDKMQLIEAKAIDRGYPLRGELVTSARLFGAGDAGPTLPEPGTAWADARLMQLLGLPLGGRVKVGAAELTVTRIIVKEPDRAGDFFNIAPRLMLNRADLARTNLIQEGSRVGYRLLVAGDPKSVASFRRWAEPRLQRAERIEGVEDARPEMRTALERAQRYLGLAALVSAILAAVAVALASRRFVTRHLDSCAMLRCLGASQATISRLYLTQFVVLGFAASALGAALGFAGQAGLAAMLAGRIVATLPAPTWLPVFEGLAVGLLLLLAFGLPPLMHLKRVPTLRVLRRELGNPSGVGWAGYAAALGIVCGLLWYRAGDWLLGAYVIAGLAGVSLVAAAFAWILLEVLRRSRQRARGVWFYGLANVGRRRASSLIQIVAFSLGLMALLLLTLVRGDLMENWRAALPPDAPNRFVINIQPDQVDDVRRFFHVHQLAEADFYPMVRGRLVEINGRRVQGKDYADERTRRLVEREFNLSWADSPRDDYRFVAGAWWRGDDPAPQFSVEQGIAERVGIALGDTLTYDVAGKRVEGKVTSLRKVAWDTMRVNFFVIARAGMLHDAPTSYITAFHLSGNEALLGELAQTFPNLTIIDVSAIMNDIRVTMERVSQAIEFVFLFTLAAGLIVLYAAMVATRDERIHEAAVMRVLGATARQLNRARWIEFVAIGTISGTVAAAGATATAFILATQVLSLPYRFDPWLFIWGALAGAAGIAIAGFAATRGLAHMPPWGVLRRVAT